MPPALETAAARGPPEVRAMPASIMGYLMPSSLHSGVLRGAGDDMLTVKRVRWKGKILEELKATQTMIMTDKRTGTTVGDTQTCLHRNCGVEVEWPGEPRLVGISVFHSLPFSASCCRASRRVRTSSQPTQAGQTLASKKRPDRTLCPHHCFNMPIASYQSANAQWWISDCAGPQVKFSTTP